MKSKRLLLTLFVCIAVLTAAMPSITIASPTTTIYVDPKYTGTDAEGKPLKPGGTFKIDIKITDAYDVVSWSFMLFWDPALLNVSDVKKDVVEGPFLKSAATQGTFFIKKPGTLFDESLNRTLEYLDVACGIYGFEYGVAGSGTLASITFLVEGTGGTSLDLRGSMLMDHYARDPIPHGEIDGEFSNSEFHDIAVTGITMYPTSIEAGHTVYINVTVENQGDTAETFNLTVYYDEHVIEERLIKDLEAKNSTILEFIWNTPSDLAAGDYTIKAVASFVPKEADTADNTYIDGKVSIPEHDIAVISITANPTEVTVGQTVSIDVTVKNKGDFIETFDVAVYYDSTFLASKSVTGLEPNKTQNLNFVWDTSGVPAFGYKIKAVAGPVNEEIKTGDNTLETTGDKSVDVIHITQSLSIGTIGAAVAVIVVAALALAYIFRHKFKS